MKSLTFGILLLVSLATVLAYAVDTVPSSNKRCTDNSQSCGSTSECCSGCCSTGQCQTQERCLSTNQGACAVHYCPPEYECYLNQVQCITAPCPPIPACRPKHSVDYDNYD